MKKTYQVLATRTTAKYYFMWEDGLSETEAHARVAKLNTIYGMVDMGGQIFGASTKNNFRTKREASNCLSRVLQGSAYVAGKTHQDLDVYGKVVVND